MIQCQHLNYIHRKQFTVNINSHSFSLLIFRHTVLRLTHDSAAPSPDVGSRCPSVTGQERSVPSRRQGVPATCDYCGDIARSSFAYCRQEGSASADSYLQTREEKKLLKVVRVNMHDCCVARKQKIAKWTLPCGVVERVHFLLYGTMTFIFLVGELARGVEKRYFFASKNFNWISVW